ncbi:MAG: roadblock/LC7 domain-containing protein [candidate division Zixibacteria bacterium]|nr:roadblock/LC7 domain-containing protein [candidate division Zixibacteria bacterium]
MYQILEGLNKTSGITGSMIVGKDGIVIAADLNTQIEEDTIGALAASITSNVQKSLERMESKPVQQVTIEADNGKMFFCDAGIGLLVVLTESEVNIGLVRLEIKNAIGKLNNQEAIY